jgi:hypothetical protein
MMPILEIPYNAKTYEMQNSIIWMEAGILYSRPRTEENVRQTREQVLAEMAKLKQITGGKKVPMIIEAHPRASSPDKDDRDFLAKQLEEVTEAMALITTNAVNKMVANLFFLFNPAPYPMKMFTNVPDARKWLQKEQAGKSLLSL